MSLASLGSLASRISSKSPKPFSGPDDRVGRRPPWRRIGVAESELFQWGLSSEAPIFPARQVNARVEGNERAFVGYLERDLLGCGRCLARRQLLIGGCGNRPANLPIPGRCIPFGANTRGRWVTILPLTARRIVPSTQQIRKWFHSGDGLAPGFGGKGPHSAPVVLGLDRWRRGWGRRLRRWCTNRLRGRRAPGPRRPGRRARPAP